MIVLAGRRRGNKLSGINEGKTSSLPEEFNSDGCFGFHKNWFLTIGFQFELKEKFANIKGIKAYFIA
jgi:hypothetical protein